MLCLPYYIQYWREAASYNIGVMIFKVKKRTDFIDPTVITTKMCV